ncbi:hypothetical protein HX773_24980 [Pantoea sp. B9002]|uniref:hypothetical protein n=1 Tax=Pantoea sp. B9002 TaxID=2726979 RepID=UPI0015A2E6CB|nr:hypothetical protein [Pantoea sp. B9002]NWA64154.1 hypothetical protein [Pantoea sp. B9002]
MLVTMTDKDLYRLGIIQRDHDHTLLQREAARHRLYQNVAGVPATTAFLTIYAAPLCI